MYRVRVTVCLLGKDGMVGLSRWLSVPFVPFPGLDLFGITSDPDLPETVAEVGWDVASKCFEIELPDWICPKETVATLIEHYGQGWEVQEPT